MRLRPLPLNAALTLALFLLAKSLSALVPPSGPSWAGKAGVQYREAVLDPDPQARVLALAILFPAGSAQDPWGREGTAFLLGRLLEGQGNRVLSRYGASLRIEVSPEEFLITLVSAPNEWREAVTELDELLYREGLSAPDLESARDELLEVLAFETGAPGRIFEREGAVFLLGATHPAARPLRGTPATVGSVTRSDLEAFRSLYLRAEEGVLAANGPVQAEELSSVLSDAVRGLGERGGGGVISVAAADSLAPAPVLRLYRSASPTLEVPSAPLGPPAWTTGQRVMMERELTSTWISVAFPFPLGTPELLLDFVGHLIIEDLTPTPPDPGLFEAQVSRMDIQDAPVLVVTASVDPRTTSRWEERLSGSLRELAADPPAGAFFELARRRFRSSVLLELAIPENRVKWLARQVATGGDPTADLEPAIWGLRRPAVSDAAAAAGPSRTLLFGSRSMMDR